MSCTNSLRAYLYLLTLLSFAGTKKPGTLLRNVFETADCLRQILTPASSLHLNSLELEMRSLSSTCSKDCCKLFGLVKTLERQNYYIKTALFSLFGSFIVGTATIMTNPVWGPLCGFKIPALFEGLKAKNASKAIYIFGLAAAGVILLPLKRPLNVIKDMGTPGNSHEDKGTWRRLDNGIRAFYCLLALAQIGIIALTFLIIKGAIRIFGD